MVSGALIPAPVLTALKECYSAREVLRTIDDFFTDLGFGFDVDAEARENAGQRRSRVAGYLATLDLSRPEDATRLLNAIEIQLGEWERSAAPYHGDIDRLLRTLRMAGYDWDGQHLRRSRPAIVEGFRWSIATLASEHVDEDIGRIIESLDHDPADAITAARALVETVCKIALEDLRIPFDERDDLPQLFKKTALALNIDPSQHEEPVYKKILQGLATTVQGLAEVRNVMGDAHGKRRAAPRPKPRHARAAAGAAWTVATFVVETLQEKKRPTRLASKGEMSDGA